MSQTVENRLVREIAWRVLDRAYGLRDPALVVLGVSNRHVHLSAADFATLFGRTDGPTVKKYVRQEGEYAAEETVAVAGPKGSFPAVRVMGPIRSATQVELSRTDCFALGINAPLAQSGQLDEAAPVTLTGPCGAIELPNAAIVAGRHVHMGEADAKALGLKDQDTVSVSFQGVRGGVLDNFLIRVRPNFKAEVHVDTDEANALGIKSGDVVRILRG